jgi:type I restriction enzyme, S subunit
MSVARKMKDSGVAWVGEIPKSWTIRRIKDVCGLVGGSTPNPQEIGEEFDLHWATPTDFQDITRTLAITSRRISAVGHLQISKTLIREGSVLISCRAPAGKVAYITSLLSFNQGCKGLTPRKEIDGVYLFYLMVSMRAAIESEARGTTFQEISGFNLGRLQITTPSLSEQRAIADYLDQQTALIDQRLSTLEEKKIVLAELRKATIHEAVTKGAVWNGDTGQVENLPTGWVMVRIKDVAKLRSGDFISAEKIETDGAFPVYGGNGLRGFAESFTHDGEFALVGRQGALCGNINYAKGKFWATEHAVVVRHKRKMVTRWLGEMLCCMNLNQYATASAQPGLSVEIVVNKFLPLPPLDEQLAIANHLDQQTQHIDAQLATLDEQAQVLKELRKAIIHEAVTGKLDLSKEAYP